MQASLQLSDFSLTNLAFEDALEAIHYWRELDIFALNLEMEERYHAGAGCCPWSLSFGSENRMQLHINRDVLWDDRFTVTVQYQHDYYSPVSGINAEKFSREYTQVDMHEIAPFISKLFARDLSIVCTDEQLPVVQQQMRDTTQWKRAVTQVKEPAEAIHFYEKISALPRFKRELELSLEQHQVLWFQWNESVEAIVKRVNEYLPQLQFNHVCSDKSHQIHRGTERRFFYETGGISLQQKIFTALNAIMEPHYHLRYVHDSLGSDKVGIVIERLETWQRLKSTDPKAIDRCFVCTETYKDFIRTAAVCKRESSQTPLSAVGVQPDKKPWWRFW